MSRHCSTCNCADDERPPQPSASNAWARRAALEAAEQAVRDAKLRRTAKVAPAQSGDVLDDLWWKAET